VSRLLENAGYELTAEPHITFTERPLRRGRPIFVPDPLWRLPIDEAFADVTLPLTVKAGPRGELQTFWSLAIANVSDTFRAAS